MTGQERKKKFSKELGLVLTVHSNEMSFSSSFICSAMLTTSLCMLENLNLLSEREKLEVAHLQLQVFSLQSSEEEATFAMAIQDILTHF